jgi:hypothetical protein
MCFNRTFHLSIPCFELEDIKMKNEDITRFSKTNYFLALHDKSFMSFVQQTYVFKFNNTRIFLFKSTLDNVNCTFIFLVCLI